MNTKALQSGLSSSSVSSFGSFQEFQTVDERLRNAPRSGSLINRRKHSADQGLSRPKEFKSMLRPNSAGIFHRNASTPSLNESEMDTFFKYGDTKQFGEYTKLDSQLYGSERSSKSRTSSVSSDNTLIGQPVSWNNMNKDHFLPKNITEDNSSLDSYTTKSTTYTSLDNYTDEVFSHKYGKFSNGSREKSSGYSSEGESSKSSSLWTPTKEANVHSDCVMVFQGHKDVVTHCCTTDMYVISSSLDTTVCVWDMKTGKKLQTLKFLNAVHDFQYVSLNHDSLLFAVLEDGKIVVWRILQDGELVCKLAGEYTGHLPNPIRTMAVSPDLTCLATGCCFIMSQIYNFKAREAVRGTVKIWDLEQMVEDCLRGDMHIHDKPPLQVRTMQQLITSNKIRKSTGSYIKFISPAQVVEKSWGIRAVVYTPDGTKLIVGFGHPDDEAVCDEKMFVVCNAFSTEFSLSRIAFAAEYKVVMYTSCCKLPWCYYCDVSLCYCDIRYHDSMQSYIFVKQ